MKKPTAGAPVPKAKVHHHARPVHVTPAVKAKRHAAAVKASKTRAANVKKAKQHPQAKQHPRRQLALGEGVACCSAEALAASLRLAGRAVSDEDVLALYWRTAADADAGASILATLEAAAEFGLGGCRLSSGQPSGAADAFPAVPSLMRPASWRALAGSAGEECRLVGDDMAAVTADRLWAPVSHPGLERHRWADLDEGHALILGVDVPSPHAVLATADGWQSWGGLYDPWTDDIKEAWEVTW